MGVGFFRQHLGDARKPAKAVVPAEPAVPVDAAQAPPQLETPRGEPAPDRTPRQRRR